MPEHKIGTREDWQAARDELAKLEAEHAQSNEQIKKKRLDLPWVPIEKELSSIARRARRLSRSCSTAGRSSSPTTLCSGPTTKTVPAQAAPISQTASTVRSFT
jgi:hypothetical protein